MPTDDEFRQLQRQVQALAAQLNAARNRIEDLEDFATDHIGLDWGESLVDINSPHPNISANTIESGGGTIRQDANGMQLAFGDESAFVTIVNTLQADPPGDYPYSQFNGFAQGAGGITKATMISRNDTGLAAYARTVGENLFLQVILNCRYNATYEAQVNVYAGSMASFVGIDYAPLRLLGDTSDPAYFEDGMLWYRSDTDKFRARVNGATRNLAVENTLIHGDGSELTIATGAITITTGYHRVDTQADAATDDLDTISGGTTGQILVIRAENDARDVVAKDGTGNLLLAGDCTLDNTADTLTLIYNGTNWLELSRSDNGA